MSGNTRVLVVEDEPHIRDFLAMALEDEGYSVETATNGREALAKARERYPHAILLDVMMPVMDGWEFLSRWFAQPKELRAPVLVMSAVDGRHRARELGAHGFLAKPFDLDALLRTLASVL